MKLLKVILLITIFLMYSNLIRSQVTIQGIITDVSDNPVSGVLVEVINELDTHQVYSSYTKNNGSYTITTSPSGIEDNSVTIPDDYIVLRNYPNPFNPSTVIYFEIPNASQVKISIFNILGREIKTLPTKFYPAGAGHVKWDATNNQGKPAAAGIYLCRLKTTQHVQVHKMILADGGNGAGAVSKTTGRHSIPKIAMLQSNSFQFTLRISGESISLLELKHLSCVNDTTINVQVGRANSSIIGSDGGSISLANGFNLQFQEGAFDSDVNVTVSEVPVSAQPDSFLSDVTQISPVISINTGGVAPNTNAIISFPVASEYQQYADSTLAIFRWDGAEWSFAGGATMDNTIYTYVRGFSLFVTGYETKDSKVYRLFRFNNTGLNNASVYVRSYQLLHPEWDVPITEDYSTPCFTIAFEPPVGGNLGWYPQGWYQFCAEWFDSTSSQNWRYRIIGGDPPNWTYSLNEYTSLLVPPAVYVNTSIAGSIEGRCPCEINHVVLQPPSIYGHWNGVFPFFGNVTIYISEKRWIIYEEVDETGFPVVLLNEAEQYVILWDNEDAEELGRPYIKFSWAIVNENQIKITIYDTHSTVSAAINDNYPQVDGVFTKLPKR